MKKIVTSILLALILLVGSISMGNVEAASRSKKKAYKAYYDWMKSSAAKEYKKFRLEDLDKDGIPELIALNQERKMTYIDCYMICAFDGTKVNTISLMAGVAGAGGYRGSSSYIPKKGKIYEYSFHSIGSYEYKTAYTLKKGVFNKKHSLSMERIYTKGKYKATYKYNNKKINKKKFKSLSKKYFSSNKEKSFEDLKYISKKKMLKKLK